MFGQMVSDLKSGKMPATNLLRKRFDAALIKKMGVIRTPYSFWPADTKINPPAQQLMWAAILLQDSENFRVIEAIVSAELEERLKAKGQQASIPELASLVKQRIQEYILDFIKLAPDEACRATLQQLVLAIAP